MSSREEKDRQDFSPSVLHCSVMLQKKHFEKMLRLAAHASDEASVYPTFPGHCHMMGGGN